MLRIEEIISLSGDNSFAFEKNSSERYLSQNAQRIPIVKK
jgi:hypothetical protein